MNPIRRLAEEQARRDSKALPRRKIVRAKSNNELNAEYHQPGYGLHFCMHDRTYYEVCPRCKRTAKEALRNLSSL